MKFWIKSALVVIPAMVLLGCSTSGDLQNESDADDGQATSAKTMSSSATTGGVGGAGSATGWKLDAGSSRSDASSGSKEDFFKRMNDANGLLATRVVYFDFDKSDIKGEFHDVLQAHGENLAENPHLSLTLEGHCDERGTREYNIALGERRAKAVQQILTLQGASPTQIRIVSYGEERPAALGHGEKAWALNRRAEIIYK